MAPTRNIMSNSLPNTRNSGRLASSDVSPCDWNWLATAAISVEFPPTVLVKSRSGADEGMKDRSCINSDIVYVDYT